MPFRFGFLGRRRAGSATAPSIPPGQRIYAIGDIHGRSDLLDRMLADIRADADAAPPTVRHTLVFLGDYVDRGADSAGVVDRLAAGPPPGFGMVCLMGNHEERMLRFLDDSSVGPAWLRFGGREALASYGIVQPDDMAEEVWLPLAQAALADALPPNHRAFLERLHLFLRVGGYAFVHAGIRPGVALDRQSADDLLWIRNDFLASEADHGVVVVHGHSITAAPEVRPNRIGIDTGAYASNALTCLVLEGTGRRFLST